MKTFFAALQTAILLVCICFAQAETDVTPEKWQSLDATEALLASLSARAQKQSEFSGQFQQIKRLTGLPMPLLASGKYSYRKNDGLVWHTTKPIDNRLVLISSKNNPNSKQSRSEEFIADIFLSVIRGDISQLQQYFDIRSLTQTDRWLVQLTPSHSALKSHIYSINISGTEYTEQLIFIEGNGDQTTINLQPVIAVKHSSTQLLIAPLAKSLSTEISHDTP